MLKSTISADERDNYLDLQTAASHVGLSPYGLYASMALVGFRLESIDNQLRPVFHKDDLSAFKDSVPNQVLSKIDLFTDYVSYSNKLVEAATDEKLTDVINRVQDQHLLRIHKETNWTKIKPLSCSKDDEILTYAQAAIYLGNISLDELDEIVLTGKLFSKRLRDSTGTYWIFKKSWLDDYLAGIRSESLLKKLVRLIRTHRSKKQSTTNRSTNT